MAFDPNIEAQGATNELFYRYGPEPEAVRPDEALYVKEVIAQALMVAYNAGFNEALAK